MSRNRPTALRFVVVAALVATGVRLAIAATTYGTNDVGYWAVFAQAVRDHGPVGIYGLNLPVLYNHGPLAGWMLVAINRLTDVGLPFTFLIRCPASLADLGSALLVFALLRDHQPVRVAAAAALAVAWSPVLVVVSGFHGNTDPLFVMLVLLSAYLLTRRERPFLAGISLALAVSIKLVPVVAVPWLLWLAFRRGSRTLGRFSAGGLLVLMGLWTPVVLTQWAGFQAHVLGYRGIALRQWGLSEVASLVAGTPGVDAVASLSLPLLLAAGLVPVLLLHGRSSSAAEVGGLGLALAGFLAVSPAFSTQYLAWGLAASYLLVPRVAHLWNVLTSVFVVAVYSQWSGGPPWVWDRAHASALTPTTWLLMWPVWVVLLVVLYVGARELVRPTSPSSVPCSPTEGAGLVSA